MALYLNQHFKDHCELMGSMAAAISMITGAILFQVGHAYQKYQKSRRARKKHLMACNVREGSNLCIHDKDCPKHNQSINHGINGGSFVGKTTNTVDIKGVHASSDGGIEDWNEVSEDSSNCDDPDDDEEGEILSFLFIRSTYLRERVFLKYYCMVFPNG